MSRPKGAAREPRATMGLFTVYPELVKQFGIITGVIASLAVHRAWSTVGSSFLLPSEWVAGELGICEKSVRRSLTELTACGYLIHAGGGDATGKPKQYKLGEPQKCQS